MRKFHLALGVIMFAAFILTGQYMDKGFDHLRGMADGPRLLYRTRHIFILLSGLGSLALAAYMRPRELRVHRNVQLIGSLAIAIASVLFVAAFFCEPTLEGLQTPLSHWAAYIIVAGTLLHAASGLAERTVRSRE